MAVPDKSILYCSKSNNSSTEKLFYSIRRGEAVGTFQALLKGVDVDIDARDSKGFTPILLACLHQRKEIVDLLIDCGASVDVKFDEGTVLHHASDHGWTNIVRTLVQKLPDLDAGDSSCETALHRASGSGCLEIVKCLVEEGADIDLKNIHGWTSIILAAEHSRKDVVNFLLDAGANVDEGELLCIASVNGWTELVHSLVKRVPELNYNSCGQTALHVASNNGHLEIVKCLVEEGFDINIREEDGTTALFSASFKGHLDIVKWLLDRGAKINVKSDNGETALHEASREGHLDIARWLMDKEADINAKGCVGQTALHDAAQEGHLEIVKWLVDKGADINVKQRTGGTPVLEAAKSSFREVVELLMHYGADVHATDENRYTLLHYASMRGWTEIVHSVVKRNCDLDARVKDGSTALSYACKMLRFSIAQCLLQAGASCDVLDEKGNSPLNYITRKNPEFKFIKLLIENGAYLKRVDYEALVKNSSLEVLQDVNLCCATIVNQFNNHDLRELYKLPASRNLPRIEVMKITSGSEAARVIEQTVRFEIQAKGHCNILEVCPMALSVISVRSVLEYCEKYKLELRNGFKRPAPLDLSNKCQRSSKKLCV